ncbi:unnamed protein product [Microthlaspi erraticum]|uniref:CCHC-type domain-containing protein n=1 Tax=Microthlaspi erraticum TaxID=1685480 RepID=A0A6D2KGR4_9BRAS|nr:unnamed protein product [Microthlaspi erraticum]
MQNRWFSNGRASTPNLPLLTAGDGLLPPPLIPPDSSDPNSSYSTHFPSLSPSLSLKKSRSSPQTAPHKKLVEQGSGQSLPATTDVAKAQSSSKTTKAPRSNLDDPKLKTIVLEPKASTENHTTKAAVTNQKAPADVEMTQAANENPSLQPQSDSGSSGTVPGSDCTVQKTLSKEKIFTILPPKTTSPILTNKASSSSKNPKTTPEIPTTKPPVSIPTPKPSQPESDIPHPNPNSSHPTLAEKIRVFVDKSLKRLAPVTYSKKGTPRILIPDAVFQEGAEIHKDFIVCYFNGRAPPYSQIQSVLNHMWGKGRRLEIHNNPLTRSMIVRIQNEYLRTKILEKGVWYVGDSMFHTAKWTAAHASVDTPLVSIQLWAHLTGVPLDLRHQKGLSLVAGLVGEPKETDDFTKNLVSLTLAHVKVEVDLTKELPWVVEFEKDSGEVVEVQVDYPWLPPKCSHCQELGHIAKNCLLLPMMPRETPFRPVKEKPQQVYQKKKDIADPQKDSIALPLPSKKPIHVSKAGVGPSLEIGIANPAPPLNLPKTPIPTLQSNPSPTTSISPPPSTVPKNPTPSDSTTSVIIALPATITPSGDPYPYSPPPPPNLSGLKRCRSSPTLSSPKQLDPSRHKNRADVQHKQRRWHHKLQIQPPSLISGYMP